MIWVGRDLVDHLVLTPLHGQGHLPLEIHTETHIPSGLFETGCFVLLYTSHNNLYELRGINTEGGAVTALEMSDFWVQ